MDLPSFDVAWRKRALAGEAGAIQQLANQMIQPLYRFCFYRVGRNGHLCEEVVQETLLRAIREMPQYVPERAADNIFPWITGLARNEIRRVLARERSQAKLEELWDKMDQELLHLYAQWDREPLAEELIAREETREMVNATMSQLPCHYRTALEAKYVLGHSVRDMAAALKTTEKSVESQLSRARQAFRATFTALAANLNIEPVF